MFESSRKKFASAFRDRIKKTIRDSGYTQNYIPYKKYSNEYLITKSKIDYPKCDLGLPIPPKDFRSGYEADDDNYIYGSKVDINKMLEILALAGFEIKEKMKILDLGCSSGRMIRQLKSFADKCEIWGTDVSADFIYWCNQYLNPPFHFATTTFNAHLPFEDKYFNLIYCGSLFTHIDNLIESWLLELRRILSNDGRLFITVHDNRTMEIFDQNKDILLASYVNKNSFFINSRKDFDMIVMNRYKSPLIFFDLEYLKKMLSSMFNIISVNPEAYGYQTGIVLSRKS